VDKPKNADGWLGSIAVARSKQAAASAARPVARYSAPRSSNGLANAGSVYVFARSGTTWLQEAKLGASDAAAGDEFGWSVAIDGETAVVGSVSDDDAGNFSGSAYVFVRSGTTWSQQAKLTASDADWRSKRMP